MATAAQSERRENGVPPAPTRTFQAAHASTLSSLWQWRRDLERHEYVTLIEILSAFAARELRRLDAEERIVRRIA